MAVVAILGVCLMIWLLTRPRHETNLSDRPLAVQKEPTALAILTGQTAQPGYAPIDTQQHPPTGRTRAICPACGERVNKRDRKCKACDEPLHDSMLGPLYDEEPIPTASTRRRVPKNAVRVDHLPLNDETCCDLGTGKGCGTAIVGESRRQTELRAVDGGRRRRGDEVRFVVSLIPEPTNEYDPHAVKIHVLNGAHIGYLTREDALAYSLALQAVAATGKQGVCQARLIGGTVDKPTIGVLIDLLDPDLLRQKMIDTGDPF